MEDPSTRKKVIVIASRPLYEPALHNRIIPFMKLLLRQRYDVCLVCPKHAVNSELVPAGVILEEVPMAGRRPRNFVKRAFVESGNSLALLRHARRIQADVFLVTIPSMFLAFMVPLILRGCKAILDVRDLSWEYLSDVHLLQRVSKRIFQAAFRRCLGFFQAVTVANRAQLSYIQKACRGAKPSLLVSNGIQLSRFESLAGMECLSENLQVTYIGNVGLAQSLDTLIEAARQLPEACFTIVGTGLDFERINQLVTRYQLSNVRLTGRVPWGSVLDYYRQSDILYAQLAPDYSGAVPSKLYEYLATGKYIIYGGEGEAAELLSNFEHYQLIPPCDADALVSAIRAYGNKPCKGKLSMANRESIRAQHIREQTAKRLITAVDAISGLK